MKKILIAFVLLMFLTGCSNYVDYESLNDEEKEAYIEIISDEVGGEEAMPSPSRMMKWVSYEGCSDPDRRDFDVRGETTFKYVYRAIKRTIEKTDYCQGDELREYICNDIRLAIVSHECDACENGRCVNASG
jgi:hypothetical protein